MAFDIILVDKASPNKVFLLVGLSYAVESSADEITLD